VHVRAVRPTPLGPVSCPFALDPGVNRDVAAGSDDAGGGAGALGADGGIAHPGAAVRHGRSAELDVVVRRGRPTAAGVVVRGRVARIGAS
jgi:hypothetical protein